MCGINGFIDKSLNVSKNDFSQMIASTAHRGPDHFDAYYYYTDSLCVGLGHNRLSIIDISNSSNQPMHFRELSIVFNGEIYNYKSLKKELESFYEFITNGDTEVLLKSIYHFGINETLRKISGMFSFVILNKKSNKVYLVRDRVGVKPLYYYLKNGNLVFSSELKGIKTLLGKQLSINEIAKSQYFAYGYISDPLTIFDHVYSLKPGCFMQVDMSCDNGCVGTMSTYWSVNNVSVDKELEENPELIEDVVVNRLKASFERRMVSDVPVGVFLSGGIDSGLLTAILSQDFQLNTFTIGFEDSDHDETMAAKFVADKFGTNHQTILCDEKQALEKFNLLPSVFDQPFWDKSSIPTFLLCEQTAKYVKVALSADGGDELFWGYNKHKIIYEFSEKDANTFKTKVASLLIYFIKNYFIPQRNITYNLEQLTLLKKCSSSSEILEVLAHVFSPSELNLLFNIDLNQWDLKSHPQTMDDINDMLKLDFKTYLPNDIMTKVDRCSMAVSLEAREPFLDHELIELIYSIPSKFKVSTAEQKPILRSIASHYLPKEHTHLPKKGFSVPLDKWLRSDLRPLINQYLGNDRLEDLGFNENNVNKLLKSFENGNNSVANRIGQILYYSMWAD